MTPVRVERAHLAAIAQLEREAFVHPWSEEALALLCTDAAFAYVILEGERALSYGGMMCVAGEGQITNIAVAPDKRRCGYGRAIVDALIRDAKARDLEQIALEVRASNEAAIALYKSLGFFEAGKRKHFYKNPAEDALVMLKPLKED
jgi:ribosomal-protein-alanine N-acetyltransferase